MYAEIAFELVSLATVAATIHLYSLLRASGIKDRRINGLSALCSSYLSGLSSVPSRPRGQAILLDHKMPVMDGVETTRRISKPIDTAHLDWVLEKWIPEEKKVKEKSYPL